MRLKGRTGNVFAEVLFKCLLAAMIGNFEFEQNGKREVVVRGLTAKSHKDIVVFVGEMVRG